MELDPEELRSEIDRLNEKLGKRFTVIQRQKTEITTLKGEVSGHNKKLGGHRVVIALLAIWLITKYITQL